MLKNILKLTLRNLYRNKLYSLINIFGLAIGLSVFLTVLAYIRYESNFNTGISDHSSIYRISTEYNRVFTGKNRGVSNGSPTYIRENFTSVDKVAQIHTWGTSTKIPQGDRSLNSHPDCLVGRECLA